MNIFSECKKIATYFVFFHFFSEGFSNVTAIDVYSNFTLQYLKVPISAQGFRDCDRFIIDVLLTRGTNVVKLATKMYAVKSESEAKVVEYDLVL